MVKPERGGTEMLFCLFFVHHLAYYLLVQNLWVIPFLSIHVIQLTFKTSCVSGHEINWVTQPPPSRDTVVGQAFATPRITRDNNTARILRPALYTLAPALWPVSRLILLTELCQFFILSILSSQGLHVAFDHVFWLTWQSPLSEFSLFNCLANFRSSFPCSLSWSQWKSRSSMLSHPWPA